MSAEGRGHLLATDVYGRGAWAICRTTGYSLRLLKLPLFRNDHNQCQRCLNWLAKREE